MPDDISRIVDNEREWRKYTLEKIETIFNKIDALDRKYDANMKLIDKDLQGFKYRAGLAIMAVSSATGSGVTFALKYLNLF